MPIFNFHALLIGVGVYKQQHNFGALPSSKDVTALRDTLLEYCGYQSENVRTLIDKDATLPRVRDELSHLSSIHGADSTVLIFFSGHGWRLPTVTDEHDEQGYLCLHETDLTDMGGTALSAQEFSQAIKAIQAERVVVILDCCHANSTAQIKSPGTIIQGKSGLSERFYQALSQGGGRVIIASCKDDENSYVRIHHDDGSVFTYHFVETLKGKAGEDGFIRFFDAFHRTAEAVRREIAQDFGEGYHQTPIIETKAEANFPIAFKEGREQQAVDGDNRGAQAPTAPQQAQPQTTFIDNGDNYGVKVSVGQHFGDSYTADTMTFNVNKPTSGREHER